MEAATTAAIRSEVETLLDRFRHAGVAEEKVREALRLALRESYVLGSLYAGPSRRAR